MPHSCSTAERRCCHCPFISAVRLGHSRDHTPCSLDWLSGHSTEARNLAETAKALGYEGIHIISYPLDVLEGSGLPLKAEVNPYSEGIEVHRPEGVGDYK
eukprot:9051-Eustigmatos_ZCMA.PRE.1